MQRKRSWNPRYAALAIALTVDVGTQLPASSETVTDFVVLKRTAVRQGRTCYGGDHRLAQGRHGSQHPQFPREEHSEGHAPDLRRGLVLRVSKWTLRLRARGYLQVGSNPHWERGILRMHRKGQLLSDLAIPQTSSAHANFSQAALPPTRAWSW
jgi:hypothetical protein